MYAVLTVKADVCLLGCRYVHTIKRNVWKMIVYWQSGHRSATIMEKKPVTGWLLTIIIWKTKQKQTNKKQTTTNKQTPLTIGNQNAGWQLQSARVFIIGEGYQVSSSLPVVKVFVMEHDLTASCVFTLQMLTGIPTASKWPFLQIFITAAYMCVLKIMDVGEREIQPILEHRP